MIIKSEKHIFKLITIIPIASLVLLTFMLMLVFYDFETTSFNKRMDNLRLNYIQNQKILIKNETEEVIKTIENARETLKQLNLSEEEIKSYILKIISKMKFGKNGYFLFMIIMV